MAFRTLLSCSVFVVHFFLMLIIINCVAGYNLRFSIKKAAKFIFLITLIIFAYIAIIGIDYSLLFHKNNKYPAFPSYVKIKDSCHHMYKGLSQDSHGDRHLGHP